VGGNMTSTLVNQEFAILDGTISIWCMPNIRSNEKSSAWAALLTFRGEVSEKLTD
jgi:hypothetical protein